MAYAPLNHDVEILLQRATTLGVPIVLVTDILATALGDRVDAALSARRNRSDSWSTVGTSLVLLDALLFGLAAQDRTSALEALEELGELRAQLEAV
jgi:DNA-binding MurR/RpiR family transcriptional regulator